MVKKENRMLAEKLLVDIRNLYNKDSYIDNSKTSEQLIEEQNQIKNLGLSLLPQINKDNKTEQLKLSNQHLSGEEELNNYKMFFFMA